jgi:hypothetical protein
MDLLGITAYVGQMVKYSNPATAVTGKFKFKNNCRVGWKFEFNDNSSLYVPVCDGITIGETWFIYYCCLISCCWNLWNLRQRCSVKSSDARILVSGSVRGPLYRSTEMNMTSTRR